MTSTAPSTRTASSASAPAARAPHFGRVVTAMVTPFKSTGELDYNTAGQLAASLAGSGSDALVIAGTTGETPTLTWAEQWELFKVVKDAVAGTSTKIIAGAGSNSTNEAIEATRRAQKMGLDGTLQVVPYYNKPPMEGMYLHFKAIADAEPDLPMMLYNIPGRTGINMPASVVGRLAADTNNVIAMKEASGDVDQFIETRLITDAAKFDLYAGDDSLTLPLMAVGCAGVVSVASHFVGDEIQKMIKLFLAGEVDAAREIHMKHYSLFKGLFLQANPIPTKAGLRMMGWRVGSCRLPLTDCDPEVENTIRRILSDLKLL